MSRRRPLQAVPAPPVAPAPPQVEIVVPVFNEQLALEPSIRRLHAYLTDAFPFSSSMTIADNASTDATPEVGAQLARRLPGVAYLRLDRNGRGLALREAWSARASSPTWTSTCRPTCRPCCRSSPRSSPATATRPSARDWRAALDPSTARAVELAVLVGANLCATIMRYLALRTWVFGRARHRPTATAIEPSSAPAERRAA